MKEKDLAVSYFPVRSCTVSSAMKSLTAEFGMGSGVPSSPGLPKFYKFIIDRKSEEVFKNKSHGVLVLVSFTPHGASTSNLSTGWSSPPLQDLRRGELILRLASRLDAFSGYPFRAWLPCYATGVTTGSLGARSSRSSRTRDKPSQFSCAHRR